MIVFLSCAKTKRDVPCKARDMYTSDLFVKSYAYAESLRPDKIYILSAKYGLLKPGDMIEPYEQTLVGANVNTCKRWAVMVYKQMLADGVNFNDNAIFLCGENYRKYLMTKFPNGTAPLKNLGIGMQKKFYAEKLKK